MSDAMSQAVKDTDEMEEYVQFMGWTRVKVPWRGRDYWKDPIDSSRDPVSIGDACQVQDSRMKQIKDILDS